MDFVQSPDCGYTLDYTIKIKNTIDNTYTPLPNWLEIVGFLSFSVFTSDSKALGLYNISIIGSVPLNSTSPQYSEELLIELKVNLDCEKDEVIQLNTPINYTLYDIVESG